MQIDEKFSKMTLDDKRWIMELVKNTCPHCLDGGRNCQCWNDE